ncbi:MAG TPA: C25 family cysteine peptidase [Candidatus Cloacimonadota bacterium]|nr:C25 family cysteine peptidase [Candidatus Cloacimonadota bacterium]
MKSKLVLMLLVVCAFLNAEWIELSSSRTNLFEHTSSDLALTQISFALDGFELNQFTENGENYVQLSYFNEGRIYETGKPDLPCFTRLYAIPDAGTVSFEISAFAEEVYAGCRVYPLQDNDSESQLQPQNFMIDQNFYGSAQTFPASLVQIGDPVIMRDVRLVPVTINAFRYDAGKNELRVVTNLDLQISCDEAKHGVNEKSHHVGISRSFEQIYSTSIDNYELVENAREVYQAPCLLYIYPNSADVLSVLDYLTTWKIQMGYEVHVASTATTGSTTSSIKNYIQNAYDTWENPPEFITLVGDASGSYSIPTYFESWSGYNGEGDQPYSQLEGNDVLADVILGRLSFETINEFQVIVSKILHYEKIPFMNNTAWYDRAVMIGDPNSSGPSCVFTKQSIAEMMGYHVPNIVCAEYYTSNFSNNMVNELNTGVSYFNYRGYYGMSSFTNSQITSLNNNLMLPFAVFLTCGTGSFANDTSRSEAFIRSGSTSSQKGAIAAIGTATTGTHTAFNNCVDLGIFYGMFVDQIYNPGGAVVKGKLHLFNSFPNNPNNRVNIFSHWNTLMGDPSIHLWTGVPQNINAIYDDELNVGSNYLECTVLTADNEPIAEAWVCALADDDVTAVQGFTDEQGHILLANIFDNCSSLTLTITAHNYIPLIDEIDMVSAPVFVNIGSYTIDDDNNGTSAGNGDLAINPGESIELSVGMHNFGTSAASNVTATMTSPNTNITITDDEETYSSIGSGNTVFSSDDFDFSVENNTLGGTDIQLDFELTDNSGNAWTDHLFLPVDGANLYASDYTIHDTNGIFEPGESVEMTVTLFNTGTIDITGIEGELFCDHEDITLIDSLGAFTTIPAGSSGNNNADRFEISADIHAINGSQLNFTLLLTNNTGFEQTVNLIIDLGTVTVHDPLGPDAYGYYAYDSNDTSYDLAPVYNWVEINPAYSGSGTVLNLSDGGDDGDVADVPVPFSFNFYGYNYDMITVCSNGWIAPGGSEQASFMNTAIPGPHGPNPMIAAFWDDLRISSGDVCYFYDSALHVFIVEWSHLVSDFNGSEETFQVQICDPAFYSTFSGDAEIIIQYQTISNTSAGSYSSGMDHGQYATVGIEDQSSRIGIGYTYNNTYPTAAMTLQNQMAIKFTTTGGAAQSPPVMQISQTNFNFAIQPNSTGTQTFQITNLGEANLIYNFSKVYENPDNSRNQGGPDQYGHVWLDSNEIGGPVYSWRDIAGLGTEVTFTHNDEGTALMPIGFDFDFYGTSYSQFRINPNGWIGFGDDNTEWSNTGLPDTSAPRPAIMGFWDDLNPLEGGNVYYYSTSDSLVVWFDEVIHYVGSYNGTYDFEMIIYADGEMLFQYREVSGDIDSATIGIQNDNADDALQICYNSAYVENELAIRIYQIIDWAEVNPAAGMVPQSETINVEVTVNSEEMETGEYLCDLILATNDPDAMVTILPIDLIVSSEFPLIHLSTSGFDFGTVLVGEQITDTLIVSNLGNQTLQVSDISLSLPEFTVDTTNFSVESGNSQEVQVTFTPEENTIYDAEMTITSNDPINGTTVVDLYGDSVYPVIGLSSQNFDFGVIDIGEEAVDTLVISNLGTELLVVSNLAISSEVFELSAISLSLQPEEEISVFITFVPQEVTTYSDTIYVYSNDISSPLMLINLSGEGQIGVGNNNNIPQITEVKQNYPNPFNPETTIHYSVSTASPVTIIVYNIKGEKVKSLVNSFHEPQNYTVVWDGKDDHNKSVSSGVYFYKFATTGKKQIKKMLLIK